MAGHFSGMSGANFDAFVSRQRTFNERDWAIKIQEKYWRARQKFLAKVEKKEDDCIVLSDSKLDSKLEIYHSINTSCEKLVNVLENYQNYLFVYSNEENALGVLLKECGKYDKTKAGKIMSIVGKSLTQSSQQRIRLYMPILRFYQEMETFHSRAVEDTADTVDKLESKRSQYRASLLWMRNISEKLDPDVYRQLDEFRKVQSQVRAGKAAFDNLQMDVVQKIDLLMASRCNLMNQILAPYQTVLLETFDKCCNNFKSVEELIKKEDIYDYEFKALKQLNSLKLDDSISGEQLCESVKTEDLLKCEEAIEVNDIFGGGGGGGSSSDIIDINDEEPSMTRDYGHKIADLLGENNLLDGNNLLDTGETSEQQQNELNSSNNNNDNNNNAQSNLMDLFTNELEEIDNSSYFKSLQKLQI